MRHRSALGGVGTLKTGPLLDVSDQVTDVDGLLILAGDLDSVGEAPLALGGVERLGARVAEENLGRVGASGRHGGRVKDPPLQGGRLAGG